MQLLIFHEKLGTDDETATTEEVLDRILYYYSNSSTERENNIDEAEMKIKHLNYCQGMIGFLHKIDEVGHDSAKTKTSIMKTIHLDQFSYIFFQCEPSIWIVLSIAQRDTFDPITSTDEALHAVVKDMYHIFIRFHHRISWNLSLKFNDKRGFYSRAPEHAPAVPVVFQAIKDTRKSIRKKQIEHESNDASPNLAELQEKLQELVQSSPALRLARLFDDFFPNYLSTIELDRLHFFYDIDGFHYRHIDPLSYLQLQSSIDSVVSEFQCCIQDHACFYDGHLVYHTMAINDKPQEDECNENDSGPENSITDLWYMYKFMKVREEAKDRSKSSPLWMGSPGASKEQRIWTSSEPIATASLSARTKSASSLLFEITKAKATTTGLSLRNFTRSSSFKSTSTPEAALPTPDEEQHHGWMTEFGTFGNTNVFSPYFFSQHSERANDPQRFVLWHDRHITLCFVLKNIASDARYLNLENQDMDENLMRISDFCLQVSEALTKLKLFQFATRIDETFEIERKKHSNNHEPHQFIYYNHRNLELRLGHPLHQMTRGNKKLSSHDRLPISCPALCRSVSRPVLHVLDEMHARFCTLGSHSSRARPSKQEPVIYDQCLQISQYSWVLGFRRDQKELYVVLNHKKYTSLDKVQACMVTLRSTVLSDLFLD